MFYFDIYNEQKVLKSDFLPQKEMAMFTTRECDIDKLFLSENIKISPQQTHSSNVKIINQKTKYLDTDALIIPKSGFSVYLRFADCTPLIFYDSINKIGAVSHAGWRGTAAKIGVKTIEKMKDELGTNPKDVIALIGPAIGVCCYEVSDDVKEELLSTVEDKGGLFLNKNVDLKKINARQLLETGVKKIDICPFCTSCNNDLFYSYRKENGTNKRHYAILQI